ncbi:MAG TPA: hypothetical protein VK154_05765 [Chitinophagales bacterium]|nr:hypothetical protein [Chitinophagales bacterium]
MKKILTSLLMATTLFSMAVPAGNPTEKKNSKATTTVKATDQKDSATEQSKRALTAEEKKAKREKALMEYKNGIWNSSNGGGRISYH